MRSGITVICMIGLLAGCSEKEIFGVPQSTWENLTPEQQSRVIDAHHRDKELKSQRKTEKIKASQSPLSRLIDNAAGVIKDMNNKQPMPHTASTVDTPYDNASGEVIPNTPLNPDNSYQQESLDAWGVRR